MRHQNAFRETKVPESVGVRLALALEPSLSSFYETEELRLRPKMQQQTNLEAGGTKVVDELAWREWGNSLARFDLEDDSLIDDQIEPLPDDMATLVSNVDGQLPGDSVSPIGQLEFECAGVDGFDKTIAEIPVDGVKAADYGAHSFGFDQVRVHG